MSLRNIMKAQIVGLFMSYRFSSLSSPDFHIKWGGPFLGTDGVYDRFRSPFPFSPFFLFHYSC